jgi:DNA-directed RNA polymerase subunit M/transcription elongation factor TFIIS
MESADQKFRQQKENYEHMSEGELCALAEDAYDLTEIAREALQVVIMEKGLDISIKMDPLALPPKYEDLVIFGWPRGAEAAGRTMKILAAAGIPSFLTLEVRPDDVNRAHAALERAYEEMDKEENAKDDLEKTNYAILCPKCHSAKVILQARTATLEANPFGIKYQWICDACGHQWVDDGITQEAAGGQSWPGEEFPSRDEDAFEKSEPK